MTYCVGILVQDGLVMIADTRTNAGIDNISSYKKLFVFETPGERAIAMATAGNLAVSQAIVSLITEGLATHDGVVETIWTTTSMFKTAQFVGNAVREVHRIDGPSLMQETGSFDVSILLGGQVKGGRLRLFNIYRAGNFIEATEDTPFLQIGETKYGKPILDRAVTVDTPIGDALKLGLISMDSTMRSNLSVGLPLDIVTIRRDTIEVDMQKRVNEGEPYFTELRHAWSNALRQAHQAIPTPPYGQVGEAARAALDFPKAIA